MKKYKTTIGIEVHAELKTKSKMFCGCKNDPHASKPNANICPVCLAHPGTLPTVNKEAIKKLVTVGTAVKGEIAQYSEFDRKNYFYPDIPKAYQLSQYAFPFVSGGELAGVKLTRIHLEEDTARSLHDQGDGSVVDFNRAGVPLMELVTEPVVHDSKMAGDFTRELQLLLRTLEVSDANMERGEMRVEANISVSSDETLGTKVEVKNLNSFKSMELAIDYEVKRQIELIENGGQVSQETRGWDENKGKTFLQRTKEGAEDYRYFPDPDIPKFDLSKIEEFNNSRISEMLPLLAPEKRILYKNLGISVDLSELIISNIDFDKFFFSLTKMTENSEVLKLAANYLTSDISSALMNNPELSINSAKPKTFLALLEMVNEGQINSRVAKDLLLEIVFEGKDPVELAKNRNLLQLDSEDEIKDLVGEIISENEGVYLEYKAGKESALQFLVGQGMKKTKGSVNPKKLADIISALE
jgi:aspartyl-tRNA(Asn)/glutamyl-tRNA(Gln) amidotransferase subunit B